MGRGRARVGGGGVPSITHTSTTTPTTPTPILSSLSPPLAPSAQGQPPARGQEKGPGLCLLSPSSAHPALGASCTGPKVPTGGEEAARAGGQGIPTSLEFRTGTFQSLSPFRLGKSQLLFLKQRGQWRWGVVGREHKTSHKKAASPPGHQRLPRSCLGMSSGTGTGSIWIKSPLIMHPSGAGGTTQQGPHQ